MSQIQVDTIVDKTGSGAPQLDYGAEVLVGYGITGAGGINVGGAVTCGNITATDATLSGTLTYDDVTNVDAVGYATFRSGINVQGAGSTTTTMNVTGDCTASAFVGDGADLTGLNIPAGFDWLQSNLF